MKNNLQIIALALATIASTTTANAETKPLKALLLTGGCCHDYATQKEILKKGIEARANVIVDLVHTDNKTIRPDLPIYGIPKYAKGYDVVIHDECAAGISDDTIIKGVLAPHKAGIPGVNLHCAMHSYRIGDPAKPADEPGSIHAQWFEYLGLQSNRHGAQAPIEITYTDKEHPITKTLGDWTTRREELYNNIKAFPTAHPLAKGKQGSDESVVTWTNDYKGTKVFSTTLGHNNGTVEDPRYLDLVTRGLLWACGKLDEKGEIVSGYAK